MSAAGSSELFDWKTKRLGYLGWWLALPMVCISIATLVVSMFVGEWLQSILIELAITFIGVLITVFYVDSVLRRREEQRQAGPRAIAGTHITRIATNLIKAVAEHFPDESRVQEFEIRPWQVRACPGGEYLALLYENDEWLRHVREEVIPSTEAIMKRLTPDELHRLEGWLQLIHDRLTETLFLFPSVLSPMQFEHILAMRQEIPVEKRAIEFLRTRTPNQLPPDPAGLLKRGLTLIEVSKEGR